MISESGSTTTYFVPPTREMTVSGVASTRSMRSGLSAKTLPLWRVTMIMAMSVRGCSSKAASIRDLRRPPIGRPDSMLRVDAPVRGATRRVSGPVAAPYGVLAGRGSRPGDESEVVRPTYRAGGTNTEVGTMDDETDPRSARARLVNSVVLGVLQQLSEASQRPAAGARPHAGDVVLGLGAV